MGNFAENLNLGNRFRPPLSQKPFWKAPSRPIFAPEDFCTAPPPSSKLEGLY